MQIMEGHIMERPEVIELKDILDEKERVKTDITTIQLTNNLITVRFNRIPNGEAVSRLWHRDSLNHNTDTHRTKNTPCIEKEIIELLQAVPKKRRIVQRLKGFVIIW